MKIITFNINGIRAHFNQLLYIIKKYDPYIISLQETKISNNLFPVLILKNLGYYSYYNGYKNYNGVAILSKIKINNIKFINNNIFKNRIILGIIKILNKKIFIVNIYVPNGENLYNKKKYLHKIFFLKKIIKIIKKINIFYKNILIFGDFNIAHKNIDIGFNKNIINKWLLKKKCSFLPYEKFLFNQIIKINLFDIFRIFNKNFKKFTWFDYRNNNFYFNIGLRIDAILTNKNILYFIKKSFIDYKIKKMEYKTSDHLPIIVMFK